MKSSFPTFHYIHEVAKAAAGMGEQSCDIMVGSVRVTVHVPFEGPLARKVADGMIRTGTFQVTHGQLDLPSVSVSKPQKMPVLVAGWNGSEFTPTAHSLN